jgi:hypothetical protein
VGLPRLLLSITLLPITNDMRCHPPSTVRTPLSRREPPWGDSHSEINIGACRMNATNVATRVWRPSATGRCPDGDNRNPPRFAPSANRFGYSISGSASTGYRSRTHRFFATAQRRRIPRIRYRASRRTFSRQTFAVCCCRKRPDLRRPDRATRGPATAVLRGLDHPAARVQRQAPPAQSFLNRSPPDRSRIPDRRVPQTTISVTRCRG